MDAKVEKLLFYLSLVIDKERRTGVKDHMNEIVHEFVSEKMKRKNAAAIRCKSWMRTFLLFGNFKCGQKQSEQQQQNK